MIYTYFSKESIEFLKICSVKVGGKTFACNNEVTFSYKSQNFLHWTILVLYVKYTKSGTITCYNHFKITYENILVLKKLILQYIFAIMCTWCIWYNLLSVFFMTILRMIFNSINVFVTFLTSRNRTCKWFLIARCAIAARSGMPLRGRPQRGYIKTMTKLV